jgi:hypothetical protein
MEKKNKPEEKPESKFAEVTRRGREQRARMPKQNPRDDFGHSGLRIDAAVDKTRDKA